MDLDRENWHTRHLFSLFPLSCIRTNTSDDGPPVRYYDEGFLLVQSMIFEGFMKAHNKSSMKKIPNIYVQVSFKIYLKMFFLLKI